MNALWVTLNDRMGRLARRERIMVTLALLFAPAILVLGLYVSPAHDRAVQLRSAMTGDRNELATLQAEVERLRREMQPPGPSRMQANGLRKELAELDGSIASLQQNLVPAQRMSAVLQEMLSRDGGLELVSLRTLPVTALVEVKHASAAAVAGDTVAGGALIYKHGIVVTVRGSYVALHDYLRRLEAAPWRLFWWGGELVAGDETRLTLTLTVYTLSFDKAWLQV